MPRLTVRPATIAIPIGHTSPHPRHRHRHRHSHPLTLVIPPSPSRFHLALTLAAENRGFASGVLIGGG
jgi:hypothetical protein